MVIRALTPALAAKARIELNEDANRLEEDLKHLKDWIAKQPHLRARTDDQFLIAFLRGCKFSLERTKEKFDLYYTGHSAATDLFRVKHTDQVFDVFMNDGGCLLLPKTMGPDSPRIFLARMSQINVNKYSLSDVIGSMDILEKIGFREDDHLTVAGVIIIIDCEGTSLAHFSQMTPTLIKKISVLGQDASPIRMKGIHLVNTFSGVGTFFNLVKSILSENNRNKLHVHSSFEELYKFIPKDLLPVECGGNGGTTEEIVAYWKNKVKEYSEFLAEEVNYGTDEHKRLGKPTTAEDLFGAEGSFRKLEFD